MRVSLGGRIARVVAVLALALVEVFVPAGPASAHAVLLETTPGNSEVLEEAPGAITLKFNEPVSGQLGGVKVFPTEGDEITPEHVETSPDGTTVTAHLPPLDPGAYAVSWRVVSVDAHPIRGAFTFSVGDAPGADAGAQLAERLRGAGGGGSDAVGLVFGVARFAVFAGLSVLVGGMAFLWLLWPAGYASARAQRILLAAWAVSLVATVAGIGLQGAYASGGSLADVFDTGLIADVLESRFGIVWLLRAGLLLPVGSLILRMGTPGSAPPAGRAARFVDGAAGAVLLLTPGLSGHASSGDMRALALLADLVHMAGIAVWLGGLVLLVAAILPDRDGPTLADVVPRFSRLATVAVVVIAVSGSFQGWRQVRYADALTDTTFGRLLLVKVALFLAILGVAAFSRKLVRGRLALPTRPVPRLAGPGAMLADPDADTVPRLRKLVAVEAVVATVVLALTAALVQAVPGREARAAGSGPFTTSVEGDDFFLQLEINPNRVGANVLHIYNFGPDGVTAQPLPDLKASIEDPERDLGPIPVALDEVYPGHWQASRFDIPLPGEWKLVLQARISEFDQTRHEFTFNVSQ
jgi:copper transport protein